MQYNQFFYRLLISGLPEIFYSTSFTFDLHKTSYVKWNLHNIKTSEKQIYVEACIAQKRESFPLRISSVNMLLSKKLQQRFPADLIKVTEVILNGKLHFFVKRYHILSNLPLRST